MQTKQGQVKIKIGNLGRLCDIFFIAVLEEFSNSLSGNIFDNK